MLPNVLFIPARPRSFKASFADLPEKNVAGDLQSGLYHVSQNFLAHFFGTRCDKRYDVTLEQSADRLSQSVSALVALTDEHGYAVAALVCTIFFVHMPSGIATVCFPLIFDYQMTIATVVAHIYTSRYGWALRRNSKTTIDLPGLNGMGVPSSVISLTVMVSKHFF